MLSGLVREDSIMPAGSTAGGMRRDIRRRKRDTDLGRRVIARGLRTGLRTQEAHPLSNDLIEYVN